MTPYEQFVLAFYAAVLTILCLILLARTLKQRSEITGLKTDVVLLQGVRRRLEEDVRDGNDLLAVRDDQGKTLNAEIVQLRIRIAEEEEIGRGKDGLVAALQAERATLPRRGEHGRLVKRNATGKTRDAGENVVPEGGASPAQ